MSLYNLRKIAEEIEKTALGISYYGNSLYVAKDIKGLNQNDIDLLDIYLNGKEDEFNHFDLQQLAIKIKNLKDPLSEYYADKKC